MRAEVTELRATAPEQDRDIFDGEPSTAELAAIEAEWPVIAAELAVLDAQIRAVSVGRGLTVLDRRRVRRAERQVLAARRAVVIGRNDTLGVAV